MIKHIRVLCGQEIKENVENLFGEKVYRELQVSVIFNDDSVEEKSYRMGQVLKSNTGTTPIMIFLGMSVLKDECSKLLLRGSYVRYRFNIIQHFKLLILTIILFINNIAQSILFIGCFY